MLYPLQEIQPAAGASLQPQESLRVSSQDAVEIGGRKVQLFHKRVGIFDILGGEEIRADHNTVGADLADQEAQGLRVIIQVVVVEPSHVLLEWTIDLQLHRAHVVEAVLDSSENEWERPAA